MASANCSLGNLPHSKMNIDNSSVEREKMFELLIIMILYKRNQGIINMMFILKRLSQLHPHAQKSILRTFTLTSRRSGLMPKSAPELHEE